MTFSLTAPASAADVSAVSNDRFTDVITSDWYYEYVDFVVSNGLFDGTGSTTFSPNMEMNRGMIVTVLGRRAGINVKEHTLLTYNDVSRTDYYASYVSWATNIGIVDGIGNGKFNPMGRLTRQDLVTILYRYIAYINGDNEIPENLEAFYKFTDWPLTAEYALNSMKWAVGRGIVGGYTPEWLYPQQYATRAQVAKIFSASNELLEKKEVADYTDKPDDLDYTEPDETDTPDKNNNSGKDEHGNSTPEDNIERIPWDSFPENNSGSVPSDDGSGVPDLDGDGTPDFEFVYG